MEEKEKTFTTGVEEGNKSQSQDKGYDPLGK